MKYIFLSLLLLIISINSYAQNSEEINRGIIANKKGTERKKIIKESKKIKIWLYYSDEVLTGRFTINDASTILVDGYSIDISQIKKIRTTNSTNQIIGGVLTLLGVGLISGGIAIIKTSIDANNLGSIFGVMIGVIVSGIGLLPTSVGIPIIFIGKKYKNSDWNFTIQS